MKSKILWVLGIAIFSVSLVVGCTANQTSTSTTSPTISPSDTPIPYISPTPDLCAPGNVQLQVPLVHSIMREFDDTRDVANLTPQTQLGDIILKLSEIRRREEDVVVPACLNDLHTAAVNYMNSVLGYLKAFMAGNGSTEIGKLITDSQSIQNFYEAERQRLMMTGTQVAIIPSPTPTLFVVTATNNTIQNLNLRDQPSTDGNIVGSLKVGESAPVYGKDETGKWIQVGFNDQRVWVFASFVSLNDFIEKLPVLSLTPVPTSTIIPSGTITATNSGQKAVNLRGAPDLNAAVVELLQPGEVVPVLGVDASGKWVLVNYTGQELWAYLEFLTLNVDVSAIPVLTITPTTTLTLVPIQPTPTP